jgi:hypothetical protein
MIGLKTDSRARSKLKEEWWAHDLTTLSDRSVRFCVDRILDLESTIRTDVNVTQFVLTGHLFCA